MKIIKEINDRLNKTQKHFEYSALDELRFNLEEGRIKKENIEEFLKNNSWKDLIDIATDCLSLDLDKLEYLINTRF